jgi:hypothetical protein
MMVDVLWSCTADIFRIGDFFNAHALNPIRIFTQLIDVERKRDTLDLGVANQFS